MKVSSFLIAILWLQSALGIVGGVPVPKDSDIMKSTAAILGMYKGKLTVYCTAIPIHERVVLTAAHCLDSISVTELFIAQGENPFIEDKIPVKAVKYHTPNYDMDYSTDIAVMLLERPIANFSNVSIGSADQVSPYSSFIQAGYGHQSHKPSTSEYPFFGKLLMLTSGKLGGLENTYVEIRGTKSETTMRGDSGGPLFVKDADGTLSVVGVTSQGGSSFTIYARPDRYLNWISCSIKNEFQLEFPILVEQVPCDNNPLIDVKNLTEHNRKMCRAYKTGWDLLTEYTSCWPVTKESCENYSEEVGGELFWDENKNSCEVKTVD